MMRLQMAFGVALACIPAQAFNALPLRQVRASQIQTNTISSVTAAGAVLRQPKPQQKPGTSAGIAGSLAVSLCIGASLFGRSRSRSRHTSSTAMLATPAVSGSGSQKTAVLLVKKTKNNIWAILSNTEGRTIYTTTEKQYVRHLVFGKAYAVEAALFAAQKLWITELIVQFQGLDTYAITRQIAMSGIRVKAIFAQMKIDYGHRRKRSTRRV